MVFLSNMHPQSSPAKDLTTVTIPILRRQLAERMAADLLRYEAYATEQDAVRSLFGRGYSTIEIGYVLGDAIVIARQHAEFDRQQAAVAREMSKPG